METQKQYQQNKRKWAVVRLCLLLLIFIVLFILARWNGTSLQFEFLQLLNYLQALGNSKIVVYIVIFTLGLLMHISGLIFIVIGMMLFHGWYGACIVYIASIIAISVNFWVVRWVGGQSLGVFKLKILRRSLALLRKNPIRAVFFLRLLLLLTTPLNTALALTKLTFKDYLLGSMLGLIIPIFSLCMVFDLFSGTIIEWLKKYQLMTYGRVVSHP